MAFGLFVEVLGKYFTHFGGAGRAQGSECVFLTVCLYVLAQ